MKIELDGRKALVTGSTAGIGLAIAEGLGRAGASVIVNGRTRERVDLAVKELRARVPGAEFIGVVADVSTAEGSASLAQQVKDVDILVNNAGTAHPKGFFEQNDADWLDLYQLNV
ncbi:MAG: SDR family NAD(P)-dependent oxidoreductase, partial [Vitreoscilla sp.]